MHGCIYMKMLENTQVDIQRFNPSFDGHVLVDAYKLIHADIPPIYSLRLKLYSLNAHQYTLMNAELTFVIIEIDFRPAL